MSSIVRNVEFGSPAALPSKTRLSLADGIGFNEWRDIGLQIEAIHDGSTWWLADWANYGDRYRRDYAPALEQLRPWQRAQKLAAVARRVQPATRRHQLTFFDHAAVAHLPQDEQEAWLDDAEAQGWTTQQLAHELAQAAGTVKQLPAPKLALPTADRPHWTRAAHATGLALDEWAAAGLDWLAANGSPHLAGKSA